MKTRFDSLKVHKNIFLHVSISSTPNGTTNQPHLNNQLRKNSSGNVVTPGGMAVKPSRHLPQIPNQARQAQAEQALAAKQKQASAPKGTENNRASNNAGNIFISLTCFFFFFGQDFVCRHENLKIGSLATSKHKCQINNCFALSDKNVYQAIKH